LKIEAKKVNYRRANIKDLETLVNYRIQFLNELETRKNHQPKKDKIAALTKNLREYFSSVINSDDFISLLAEYGGRIVATGSMVVWRRPPNYGGLESGRAGYIINLYTIPEARRSGICTKLLSNIIAEAKTLKLKYLHLHAEPDGIGIYKSAGFAEPDRPELILRLE
jgi:ribosomal protein S18 acetylase RimI-like enzyme